MNTDHGYHDETSVLVEKLADLRAENAELRAEIADNDRLFAEGAVATAMASERVIVQTERIVELEGVVAAQQQLLHLADAIISGGQARELLERLVGAA